MSNEYTINTNNSTLINCSSPNIQTQNLKQNQGYPQPIYIINSCPNCGGGGSCCTMIDNVVDEAIDFGEKYGAKAKGDDCVCYCCSIY